ncbi:MAG: dicarboxylate/amino acid:cation symporter [Dysgonamonadaceae bacterium]|nr:dicarboxylate/amino acid:cation symporter [Dysgonamonadaceae bacterium]MDD3357146.1 dicarboxylate/amino acid:cation symporter [Dysgonamonadaceae bacterium]MDD3727674.1 dicarboxylate/amino acid:cation symporter [Dysgonamonadaceae bacterium]HUI32499.1 dicarboxylate/amino acid:cation symporter [Dysgonamonadaceae bacterium]
MKFKFKIGLLPKVIIAIVAGIVASLFFPLWATKIFVTITGIFSSFLSFVIPLIILGLIAPGIAELGRGAGKLLAITALIAYGSTILAGFFSYFSTRWSLPLLLSPEELTSGSNLSFVETVGSYFTIDMPPLMSVTTSLILAFVIGLGVAAIDGDKTKEILQEFREIIIIVIEKVIIPFLPLYIFGIFLKIGAEGQVALVLGLFFKVIIVIFVMHVLWLLFQFITAGAITNKNPFRALITMMPAYMTALGTQSSAATIPVTLMQAKKNGVDEDVADFVIPLCATIHLSGSMLKIVACAYAIMFMSGMNAGIELFAGFIMMLGITMIAAPGVPGGAIMAAIALLQSMLGFDETLIGLMVALYITMDSFGTACNVTGDGAIAMVMNKVNKRLKRKKEIAVGG